MGLSAIADLLRASCFVGITGGFILCETQARKGGAGRAVRAVARIGNGGDMRAVHVLRKWDRAEWGGTETAMERMFAGLSEQGVDPVLYCPRANGQSTE